MDYARGIARLKKEFTQLSFLDLETAIVCAILENEEKKNVRNLLIRSIILRKSFDTELVLQWFNKEKICPSINLLEKFYELNIDDLGRKLNGAYYTPEHIVSFIVRETMAGKVGTVCDPACGSGAFLIEAAKQIKDRTGLPFAVIYRSYIYGVDILEANINHIKTALSLLAILHKEDRINFRFNIECADSLGFAWEERGFKAFDFVVGNPPYVRAKNADQYVRNNISKWKTGSSGIPDLYIPFFELATRISNTNGRIGYITPSTYFTSVNARALRKFLAESQLVEKIIDFNGWQVFKGATTYTCITILCKSIHDRFDFAFIDKEHKIGKLNEISFTKLPLSILDQPEWRLLNKKDAENILRIENTGSPLHKYVKRFVTGIATLDNDLFLVEDTGSELLLKSYDGKNYFIERGLTKSIIKPNKIKDYGALRRNKERIIYPYERHGDQIVTLPESKIKHDYPRAYEYLLAIKGRLALRNKKDRAAWYAYGRSQGLDTFGRKIILPMMGDRTSFLVVNNVESLIYCGYAIFPKEESDYALLEKILNSDVMWLYIKKTSKNYSGGFKSFAKNYVKNFSIPDFSDDERNILLSLQDRDTIDSFLKKKYQLT